MENTLPKTYRESRSLGDVMQDRALTLDVRRQEPELYRPVPTGIPDLDKVIGGIPVADPSYILLFSNEKIGKTTIGMHLAEYWRKGLKERGDEDNRVLYVQLEELASQYADRVFSSMTSLTRNKIRMYEINDEEMKEIEDAANTVSTGGDNLWLQDNLYSLNAIVAEAKRLDVRRIVLDNLQLLDKQAYGHGSEREKLSLISQHLMNLRNEEGFSFIVVSQMGADGKAFGSTQANKDADILIQIGYVTEENSEDEEEVVVEGLRALHVLPSRLCAPGYAEVAFDGSKNKITPIGVKDVNSDDFLAMLEKEGPPPLYKQEGML